MHIYSPDIPENSEDFTQLTLELTLLRSHIFMGRLHSKLMQLEAFTQYLIFRSIIGTHYRWVAIGNVRSKLAHDF